MTETTRSEADFADVTPTRRLDMCGQTCPVPTTETLHVLEEMAAGEVLEVESDYYPAKWTIPYLCKERGYPYALSEETRETQGNSRGNQLVWWIRILKT